MNKFLLVAINSKYIHSNLAVYCLKAATAYSDKVYIREFTINNQLEDILKNIYLEKPDVIGISCYIWNINYVKELLPELNKLLPGVKIWLGGPEVSYNTEEYAGRYENVAGVIKGEGEAVFKELMDCYMEGREKDIPSIPGITTVSDGKIIDNPCTLVYDMSDSVMPYYAAGYKEDDYKNKIIYYESSRGCPFSCSYCLSSVDKHLRFRNTELVLTDLKVFLDNKVALVKFVDRTFNCNREHSRKILRFIRDNDNGITSFHFEIAADILEEDIRIMNSLRPGLIQLEIGVQSTNQDTIKAIHRVMNLDKLRNNVAAIRKCRNIHMHLDLIAGLPYEDINSFRKSFNDIYDMKPDNLQLGFLKLLHGSLMREEKDKYGIVARDIPPYEVLYTKYLSYDDILKLKQVEKVLDMYYNSNMFVLSVRYLSGSFDDSFAMYELLSECFERRYSDGSLPSRNGKFELLYDFAGDYLNEHDMMVFGEMLRFDMYLRDNVKSLPECFAFNKDESLRAKKYSGEHKLTKAEHIEIFKINPVEYRDNGNVVCGDTVIYFDYLIRDYDNNATIKILEETK
ncbi:MAG: B12-binding domain-containing radical SAM protein [Butyrivibrio crossotus]|nr:B12-binding domain-containing radical SAM protein [Butyrivibrio crossotus]